MGKRSKNDACAGILSSKKGQWFFSSVSVGVL
jgi:hypothetical protein